MKKLLAFVLVLALALTCSVALADHTDNILYGWTTSPTTLNPHMYTSTTASTRMPNLGTFVRQMVSKDGTSLEFVPEHAAELPTSSDGGYTWTVKLRDGLKWTDGTPIDAYTYEYSMKMLIDPKLVNTAATYLFDPVVVKNAKEYFQGTVTDWNEVGIKVLDANTIEFSLEYPCTDIDFYTTICQYINPVKEDLYEACMNGDRTATTYGTTLETTPSCGYFILTEWVIDGYYAFEINPDDPLVQDGWFSIDGEHDQFLSSSTTRSELFWNGDLDYHTLTGTEYDTYKDDPRVYKNMTSSVWGLFVNSASKNTAMANKNLRLALQYAAPREEMSYDVYKMYTAASYMVAESIFVDDGAEGTIYLKTEGAQAIKEKYATNRDLALEYFNKAYEELGGQKITVGYIYFDQQEDMKRTAEVAKEIFENLFGADRFELALEAVLPQPAYDRYRAGDYDLGIGVRLCSPFNPWTSMAPWTTDYADKYITGFDNEEFDQLQYDCVYGDLLNDPQGKIEALNRMEELLLGEVAFIPLMQNDNSVIYNERIWLPTEEFLTGVGYGLTQCTIENTVN